MQPTQTATRPALRQAWSDEMGLARAGRDRTDAPSEWNHLERAHILSQPTPMPIPDELRAILDGDRP